MIRCGIKSCQVRGVEVGCIRRRLALLVLALVALPLGAEANPAGGPLRLGQQGFLIIASARDTTTEFHWQQGPGPDRRSLVWSSGQLVIPDSLVVQDFGHSDLGVTVGADLQGSGAGGILAFGDGVYPISEPLLLTDGTVSLMASAGELEIRGAQLRYLAPASVGEQKEAKDPRAGFIFLMGMLLLVGVLLRRARMISKARAGRP